MPGADGMTTKFMKSAFVGWTFTAGLYYPPDFDSTKLMPLKALRPKGQKQAMNMRMMFPFTMICDACGEYNYPGTKFTARVETITHETYLGLKVFRFYGRCRHCFSEFTFKTDPKNSDYTMESGGKRTYEAWKDADMVEAQLKQEKEQEAAQDQMKALEQKSVDVQAEMERLEDLDAIRTMNRRLGCRDQTIEEALNFLFKQREQEENPKENKALCDADAADLEGFMEAQEERRRLKLETEVDGEEGECADKEGKECADKDGKARSSAPSSSSKSSGSGGAGAKGDAASPGDASPFAEPAVAKTAAAKAPAAGSAIAAAVAERAKEHKTRAIGALLVAKRKAPPEPAGADSVKALCTEAAPIAAEVSLPPVDAGGGMMGLGGYDSDSS